MPIHNSDISRETARWIARYPFLSKYQSTTSQLRYLVDLRKWHINTLSRRASRTKDLAVPTLRLIRVTPLVIYSELLPILLLGSLFLIASPRTPVMLLFSTVLFCAMSIEVRLLPNA